MNLNDHVRVTGSALKNWIVAQFQDSLAVGILWMVGLYILGVPWAPFWAFLAAVLQFVPHLGAVLGMIGPVLAATIRWGDSSCSKAADLLRAIASRRSRSWSSIGTLAGRI